MAEIVTFPLRYERETDKCVIVCEGKVKKYP